MAKIIHNCDTYNENGAWTSGADITNIETDGDIFKEGLGSVKFDIVQADAQIKITDMDIVDLSNYENNSLIKVWLYIPTQGMANSVTELALYIGSNITNFWIMYYDVFGKPLIQGWNLLEFKWTASIWETGSPNSANITYLSLGLLGEEGDTIVGNNYRIDYFRAIMPDENEDIDPTQRTKKYFIKIYEPNGKYINTISDASFNGFRKQINGGLGEFTFDLARKFDDFNEDYEIKHNNKIEIWVSDKDTASTGKKIYTGYISSYNPYIDGSNEGVKVTCLGYVSKLNSSLYKNGSTVEIVHSSVDPSDIVKDIQTRFRTEATRGSIYLNSDDSKINDTGTTVSYTFNSANYYDALNKCIELAPSGWWWYLDEDNKLEFSPTPSVATHKFIFGKDFKKVEVIKNMEAVVNNVLFNSANGEKQIFKRYNDSESEDEFDDRWEQISDSRVEIEATADEQSNAIIDQKKAAEIQTSVEIIDNNGSDFGYDIESINPGDTCKFLGFNTITSKTFSGVMLIKAVDYELGSARLELETLQESLARKSDKNRRAIQEQINTDNPTSYPVVNVTDTISRKIIMFGSAITVLDLSNQPATARTNLDLSSYVSDKAKAVFLRIAISDSNDANSILLVYPDTADTVYDIAVKNPNINIYGHDSGICRCDTNQIIEYQISNSGSSNDCDVVIQLLGYIE